MFQKLVGPIKGMRKTRETTFIARTFESFPPRNWFDREGGESSLSLFLWLAVLFFRSDKRTRRPVWILET